MERYFGQTHAEFIERYQQWAAARTAELENPGRTFWFPLHCYSIIQIFSSIPGKLIREIGVNSGRGSGGKYAGVVADMRGHLLATRIEKTRSFIHVFDYKSGRLLFAINSSEARLRRPTSLATTNDDHVIVVDLGNDCIKKYRYI